MDPNTLLDNILSQIKEIKNNLESYYDGDIDWVCYDLECFVEDVSNLNEWLSNGGFLPDKWNPNRKNPHIGSTFDSFLEEEENK